MNDSANIQNTLGSESSSQDILVSPGVRVDRELLEATRPFGYESPWTSRLEVLTTYGLLCVSLFLASRDVPWGIRTLFSLLSGLIMVRAFITYHDYMHGAILRNSKAARLLFECYGALILTPPRSWQKSHNFHHGHIGQLEGSGVGSFRIMTLVDWSKSSLKERLQYRIERHPLIVLFAYPFVFLLNITLLPLLRDPKRHWDSAVSLLTHFGLIVFLWHLGGFALALFVIILPMFIASGLGGYLFFAQHSFKRMKILTPKAWTFYRAALQSSSYMKLNRLMQWFTGNIGYHHIHHLNVRIPFYRLPEAMAAIPELQTPATTTLTPAEIVACFQANLWDEENDCMVNYP